jgi:hypothetical protein
MSASRSQPLLSITRMRSARVRVLLAPFMRHLRHFSDCGKFLYALKLITSHPVPVYCSPEQPTIKNHSRRNSISSYWCWTARYICRGLHRGYYCGFSESVCGCTWDYRPDQCGKVTGIQGCQRRCISHGLLNDCILGAGTGAELFRSEYGR